MLDVLAQTDGLAREAELLLDGLEWCDGGRGRVGAVQVPGVEAGEVLEGTEDLVAADDGRDEAEVVGEHWVVGELGCDHVGGCIG